MLIGLTRDQAGDKTQRAILEIFMFNRLQLCQVKILIMLPHIKSFHSANIWQAFIVKKLQEVQLYLSLRLQYMIETGRQSKIQTFSHVLLANHFQI